MPKTSRFRRAPQTRSSSAADPDWQREQQEADIRLLGLISYAADPWNIDLSDHPERAEAIAELNDASQPQTKTRR